ncbi:hypothetical protein G3M48_007495 [Beauveria asiatica]|uniref:C2H2-type domain-containing protein n=1 Tax=Beauveria asiatica TaxID=1069075 RepID=A0AAW0RMJ8_9HYPO
MFSCDVCNSVFLRRPAATQHKKETKHCYCQICEKALESSKGLQDHNDAVHCHSCPGCTKTFVLGLLLTNHQKAKRHCYCGDCNRVFATAQEFKSHMQTSLHSTEFRCCDCDREFNSGAALNQHLRHKVHRRPAATTKSKVQKASEKTAAPTFCCSKCSRSFDTEVSLEQHLASLAHRPLGSLSCFAGASCKAKFCSPSGVLQHLESGACPSGMDLDQLKILILKYDTERLITRSPSDGDVLLEGQSDVSSDLIRTPSSLSLSSSADGCWTPTSGSLSDWTMLISQSPSHRCPFCPLDRRPFRDARALQNHIHSAAHHEPFIYCPAAISGSGNDKSKAIRKFTTISGLAQHLESGACIGGEASFWKAIKYIDARLQKMGMQFRLTQEEET